MAWPPAPVGDPRRGWHRCAPGEDGYPALLATIAEPPDLVVRGALPAALPLLAIVGARRCTQYGEEVAYEMASQLAASGFGIVSGLARGIDAAAHRGALDAGGVTIAVMGTGPDTVYPPEHAPLADRIALSGAVITQFPAGTPPAKANFPLRNATISGLSLGVVVVEARRQSGAMLTAGAAGNQGRTVMAVPGSVHNPASRGCHDLLRDGVHLVTCAAEVLQELSAEPMLRLLEAAPGPAGRQPFADARDQVLDSLLGGPRTLEGVAEALSLPTSEVVAAVARLRLDGYIRCRDGVYGLVGNPGPLQGAAPGRRWNLE